MTRRDRPSQEDACDEGMGGGARGALTGSAHHAWPPGGTADGTVARVSSRRGGTGDVVEAVQVRELLSATAQSRRRAPFRDVQRALPRLGGREVQASRMLSK
ncbi:hypothetical protein GCM10023084_78160 [Streptomyces lacrimifluminis]|uniref:Uncharacterized protein n=1 Tax=Streptomyces lacrimifluminis TaxID=1500077 RepID=A0A917P9R1_9ACTN|nr:hypothetical protein GCM10012282_76200 [Streptomyces lacrimifluminis]